MVSIAGDTIWCPEVATAIEQYQPAYIVVNAGAAQFLQGDLITMGVADVIHVCQALPSTKVIAVHMEVVNHCLLRRDDLRAQVAAASYADQVLLPLDGETIAV